MTMKRTVRIVLVGLGNLGRRFCDLLVDKGPLVEDRYGLELVLVGAADSGGSADAAEGLDPARIAAIKRAGRSVADLEAVGRRGRPALELVGEAEADLLCEASPVNLDRGAEPGLSHVRTALRRGLHVVTPNKGPLVVAYRELHDLAARQGVALRFDGTVAGGLPALNLGRRDMRGATVERIEAVPNLCTGYVMDLLAGGSSWDEAREQARAAGVLEGDGSFDLEGWDAAAKLVILVNHVMDVPTRLEDVDRTGITGLSGVVLRTAQDEGRTYKLVATAERRPDGSVELTVSPTPLPPGHFLAALGAKQMGVIYRTDIYGTVMAAIDEPTPVPSAATMLRDTLDIFT